MKIVQDVRDVIWLRAILLRCEYPLTLGPSNKADRTMANERYARFLPSQIPTRLPRLRTSLVGKWRKRVYMYGTHGVPTVLVLYPMSNLKKTNKQNCPIVCCFFEFNILTVDCIEKLTSYH